MELTPTSSIPRARSRSMSSAYSASRAAATQLTYGLLDRPQRRAHPRAKLEARLLAEELVGVEAPTRKPWPRFAPWSKRPLPRSNLGFFPAPVALRPSSVLRPYS